MRWALGVLSLVLTACNFDASLARYCENNQGCGTLEGRLCIQDGYSCSGDDCCARATCDRGEGRCVPTARPRLAFSPSAFDFGSGPLGLVTAEQTFRLSNSGTLATSPLSVSWMYRVPSSFEVVANGCEGVTLATGATCTVTLRALIKLHGTQRAQLSAADLTEEATLSVEVLGED